ncbi:hypothetical protein [Rhizobium mulingense]|uniref:hypothetical protein n=1 Tax=Rhizobium mulingense TaxID=3031128 RepID=UPI002B48637C|nr:hypothetical protein [Rhizobium sp. MJ21]MEB3044615.1 hypothetical protein [Rhizobium sp. MJ21]
MSELLAIVSQDADYYLMLSYILKGAGYRTMLVDIPSEAVTTAEELELQPSSSTASQVREF